MLRVRSHIERQIFHYTALLIAGVLLALWFAFVLPFVTVELIPGQYVPEFAKAPSAQAAAVTMNWTVSGTGATTEFVSPASDELVLLGIVARHPSSSPTPIASAIGNGLTWVPVRPPHYFDQGGTFTTAYLFRAMGSSFLDDVSISFSQPVSGIMWSVTRFGNVDTGGTNGSAAVVQSNVGSSDSNANVSTTLGSFANSDNATYGIAGVGTGYTMSPGSGFTPLGTDENDGTGGMIAEWRVDNATTVNANVGGSSNRAGIIGIEIAAAPTATEPTLSNPTHGGVTATTATLGARLDSDGGDPVQARGTCWETFSTPTPGNCLAEGFTSLGVFSHLRTGLPSSTLIFYRGYAENDVGRGYSNERSFTTSAPPVGQSCDGTPANWCGTDWQNRVRITVQASEVDTNVTNFPVYVDLSNLAASFHTNVRSDGGDIRVTKSNGETELPRELVVYNSGSNTGELHFKADFLSSSVNTDFYLYYGNASATDYAINDTFGAENVWTSGYVGVWHLEESSTGPWLDSTTNDNDATWNNGSGGDVVSIPSAQLERGLDWPGASSGDYATLPTAGMTIGGDQLTLSGWARTPSIGVNDDEALINGDGSGYPYMIGIENASGSFDDTNCRITNSSLVESRINVPVVPRGVWTWLTCRYTGSTHEAYVDGSWVSSDGQSGNIRNLNNAWFSRRSNTRRYEGDADELRVQNTARTPEWISTEYNNQATPGTFYAFGPEETQVSNADPTVTLVDHSPPTTLEGNLVQFDVTWNDPDGDPVRAFICQTNEIAAFSCPGGEWTSMGSFSPIATLNLWYPTLSADVGTSPNDFWAFVCDDIGGCSSGFLGNFSVGGAPIITADVSHSPFTVLEGQALIFSADWSDADDATTNLYVCTTTNVTTAGCVDGTWAQSLGEPFLTAEAGFTTSSADVGFRDYYVFVCDALACSQTSESAPDTHRQFTVFAENLTVVNFFATPPAGIDPLNATLTAEVGGTAPGSANYNFWWNCSYPGTDFAGLQTNCGAVPVGSCNADGCKFDGIASDSFTTPSSHTYQPLGTYTPRVLVQRGSSEAHAQTTVQVSTAPVIDDVNHTPEPVLAGQSLQFVVDWHDDDGDRARAHLCRSNQMSVPDTCDAGSWESSPLDTDPPGQINLFHTPTPLDIGPNDYWVFVCDENLVCAGPWPQRTFNVGGPPVITANVSDNGPVLETEVVTFFVSWADGDDNNVTIYVCDSDGATAGGGCSGGEYASTSWFSPTGSDTAQLFYTTQLGDVAASPHNYWAFVCDSTDCSSTSSVPLTFSSFNVTTQSLNIDSFFAIPPSGPDPLSSFLEVEFNGTGTSDANYNYWWDCNNNGTDPGPMGVGGVCGNLNTPAPGSCTETGGVGYKCNGIAVPPFVHQSANHDYLSGGPYTGKVIVERGSLSREARTTITIGGAPTITSAFDSPDPVLAGNASQFTVLWNDPEGDPIRAHVCKSDQMSVAHICDAGAWGSATQGAPAHTDNPTLLWYDTTGANVSTSPNDYWIFVCDDGGSCSTTPWPGQFSVTFAPVITADVFHTPEPSTEGGTILFQIPWADDDPSVNVYLCDSDSVTISGCTGGTRASTVASSSPAVLTLDTTPLGAGTYHYWAFVCDTIQCSVTSNSSPTTHEDFTVDAQQIVIDSFVANPDSGLDPLNSILDAAISGTAEGNINYTFWWDCADGSTDVAFLSQVSVCDNPSNSTFGDKHDGVGPSSGPHSQQTINHLYPQGTYTAKVVIERGLANAVTASWTVNVSSAPQIISVIDDGDPVLVDDDVTFTVTWTDPDSSQASIHICRTASMTNPGVCDGGDFATSPLDNEPPGVTNLFYTTTIADAGQTFYFVFGCDSSNACTPVPTVGDFTAEFTPSLTTQNVSHSPDPILQGNNVKFFVYWSDPDSGTVTVYICDSPGVDHVTGCTGIERVSAAVSGSPAQLVLNTGSLAPGGHGYYAYVCDNLGCTDDAEPFTNSGAFTVTAQTLTINSFLADTPSGADPHSTFLIVEIDGSGNDSANYTFWWDCNDGSTDVAFLSQVSVCGNPSLSLNGDKYDGIPASQPGPWTQPTVNHSYSPNGIHTSKVVVERGTAPAQTATTTVTVSARPNIVQPVIVNPNPVIGGQPVGFTINWTDADSPQASGHLCRTAFMTNPGVCDDDSWADSPVSSDPSLDLIYFTIPADVGTQTFHAFVCDNSSVCTATPVTDTFTVEQTPIITSDVSYSPDPALEADIITFNIPWSDDGTSVTAYVCDAPGVTVGGGCSGGEWASETTSFTLAQPTLDTTGLSVGLYDYYAYVCDNLGCSGLSETSPDTHKRFEISGQVIIIDTFDAIPPSGVAPLTSSLEVSISGTANDTINYSFWWDCNDAGIVPGTGLGEVGDVCGALTAPAAGFCTETPGVGYKCDGVGPLFGPDTQPTIDHVYPLGSYTGKVIVERGEALAVEERTDVESTLDTFPQVISVGNNGPVDEGDTIFFDVTWKDDEGITPLPGYVVVCKSDVKPTGFLPSGPTCPDDHWDNGPVAVGGLGTTTTVHYSTQTGDIGTWTGWIYVCQAEDECSAPVSNVFKVQTPSPAVDLIDIELSTVFTSYDIGDSFSYELRVTNNGIGGLIDASNVEVVVTLPSEVAIQNPIPLCGSPAVSDPPPTVGATGVTVTCDWTTISVGASPVEFFNVTAVTEKINAVATATLTAVSPEDDSPAPGYSGNNADIAIVTIGDTSSNPPPTLIDQFRIPTTVSQGPSIFWDDELAGGPFNAQNVNVSVSGEISLADPGLGFGHITSVPIDTRAQDGVAFNAIRWDGDRPGTESDPRFVVYDWMYSKGSGSITVNCGQLPGGNTPGPGVDPFTSPPGVDDPVCDAHPSGEWFMDVSIETGRYSGWIWSDLIGWIALSCDTAFVDNCDLPAFSSNRWGQAPNDDMVGWGVWEDPGPWQTDAGTGVQYRRVRGWAWSPIAGWIAMGCDSQGLSVCGAVWDGGIPRTDGYDGTDPSSSVAPYRGNADSVWVSNDVGVMRYHGWAWSSHIGWISFDCNQVLPGAADQRREYNCTSGDGTPGVEADHEYNPWRLGVGGSAEVRFWVATSDCPNGASNPPTCTGVSDWEFVDSACTVQNEPDPNLGGGSPYNLFPISDPMATEDKKIGDLSQCPDQHWNKRYARYRVLLCTFNDCIIPGIWRPIVRDVLITYSP